jgi:hypothetical protein
LLETVTAKDVPALDGAAVAGLTVQVGGDPGPQLSVTVLLYPLSEVIVPLNCADEFTDVVSEELEIVRL